MALFIDANEFISCGDCEPACPTDSITEGVLVFKIDPTTCTECVGDYDKPQCVRVCPIDRCILPLAA